MPRHHSQDGGGAFASSFIVAKTINTLQSRVSHSQRFWDGPTLLGAFLGSVNGPVLGPRAPRGSVGPLFKIGACKPLFNPFD